MGSYIWFIRVLMLYNIFPFLFRNQVTIKELKESRTKGGNKDIKVLFELHPKRDQIDQTEPMVLLCSRAAAAKIPLLLPCGFLNIWFQYLMCGSGYKYGAQPARLILPKWQNNPRPQSRSIISPQWLKDAQNIWILNGKVN